MTREGISSCILGANDASPQWQRGGTKSITSKHALKSLQHLRTGGHAGLTFATSLGCGEERASLGSVVNPIWLLRITWMVPPVVYSGKSDSWPTPPKLVRVARARRKKKAGTPDSELLDEK